MKVDRPGGDGEAEIRAPVRLCAGPCVQLASWILPGAVLASAHHPPPPSNSSSRKTRRKQHKDSGMDSPTETLDLSLIENSSTTELFTLQNETNQKITQLYEKISNYNDELDLGITKIIEILKVKY